MTINEYLRLASELRRRAAQCEKKYYDAFLEATSTPSALGRDGVPSGRGSGNNATEIRLVAEADAARELREAYYAYSEHNKQLWEDIYNLYYWEGLIIDQVYIRNPITECEDPLYGVGDILQTSDRRMMQRKVNEAKTHLAEIMRARGADIDN